MTIEPLVNVVTGEVIEVVLTPTQARDLTDRIRQTLHVGHDLIVEAFKGSAWSVLGYDSWDAYCAGEFAGARMVRLDREQRREIVAEMRQSGMSSRAIASGLGVGHATVARDVQGAPVSDETPAAPVIGLDGKTYQPPAPRPQPAPAKPRPQRDDAEVVLNRVLRSAQDAAREAQSLSSAQLTRIRAEASHWTAGLSSAIEVLQDLVTSITGDTP